MIKTRIWIAGLVVLSVLCICLTVGLLGNDGGSIACISQNGEVLYEIDLEKVTEPYEIELKDECGTNIIMVENGRICMSFADCPDHLCVETGWISDSSAPIVCLPHKVMINLQRRDGQSESDAAAG